MEQKSNGALISAIIIILVLIVGGIYFWKTSVKNKVDQNAVQVPSGGESGAGATDTSDIENDLNGIDVNNLDQGL